MIANLKIALKMLVDFNNFVGDRSTLFLIRPAGMLKNILGWHFNIWKKEYEYLYNKDKLDEWADYSEISRILDSIFQQIELRALQERSSSFFKGLENHVERHKNESVKSHYYIDSLLNNFYRIFFENIESSPDRNSIWEHYFPKEWKVTKMNLDNNIVARTSLNIFMKWASDRIWQTKEEFDKDLNDVSSNLFPETAPILWARILIFVYSPYSDDRIREVIKRPWNFGRVGRVRVGSGEDVEEPSREDLLEEEKSFELAGFLFKKDFSKDNLEKYIESLNNLESKYQEGSKEENKRLSLLQIFTKMLEFLRSKELPDST